MYEDELTGFGNKRKFDKTILGLEQSLKKNRDMGFCLVDIHNLRFINERIGYNVGDKVVSYIAEALLHNFQDIAQIFRISGGVFVLIVSKEKKSEAENAYDSFWEEWKEKSKELDFICDIAYGSAFYNEKEDFDLNATFVRADSELYLFKRKLKTRTGKVQLE